MYVTSQEILLNGYSVKTMSYNSNPPPLPIIHCIRLLGENITGQGYRVSQKNNSGLPILRIFRILRTFFVYYGFFVNIFFTFS